MSAADWYYVDGDNNRVGPVDQETIGALVAEGELGSETLIWYEGMGDWKPYNEITGESASDSSVSLPSSELDDLGACCECGNVMPSSQLHKMRGSLVCGACKPTMMRQRHLGESLDRGAPLDYAGFWIRLAAKFIDGLLILVLSTCVGAVVVFLMGGVSTPESAPSDAPVWFLYLAMGYYIGSLLQMLIYPLYQCVFVGKYGATLGKMLLGLRVVTASGDDVGYSRAIGRALSEMINFFTFLIGYLIAGIDSEKRALHDFLCGTRVVRI